MGFDEYIDRNQYPTLKWGKAFLAEHFRNEEAIPMSVADMDIKSPPTVERMGTLLTNLTIYSIKSKKDIDKKE